MVGGEKKYVIAINVVHKGEPRTVFSGNGKEENPKYEGTKKEAS